jgi:hypothetical protein
MSDLSGSKEIIDNFTENPILLGIYLFSVTHNSSCGQVYGKKIELHYPEITGVLGYLNHKIV